MGPSPSARASGPTLRVLADQPAAACNADETMISALCPQDGSTLHFTGVNGASCDGAAKPNVVVVCAAKR